jgi:hypothetical protein
MIASLGFETISASASSDIAAMESAFCTTIAGYPATSPPSPKSVASYRSWAGSLESFYGALANEAPSAASRTVFRQVFNVLRYYVGSRTVTTLDENISKYQSQWKAGTRDLTMAIRSCARTLE